MKKMHTLLLGLGIIFMASFSFTSPASAATHTTITNQNGHPSVSTTGTLFDIQNLNPGDTHATTITFTNQTSEDLSLTLRDMGQTFDRSSLAGLTFTLRDSSGTIIAQTDNLYDLFNRILPSLPAHTTITYTLEIHAPTSLDNSYQGAINTHFANFVISATKSPTAPKTGFSTQILGDYTDPLGIFLTTTLSALLCLLFVIIRRRRHAKNEA